MSLKRRSIIICISFVIALIIPASQFAFSSRDDYNKDRKHFLWEAEGENNSLYLIGSIHVLKKDSYPLPAAVERVYNCCDKVIFETDLEGMNDVDLQAEMIKLGSYPAGRSLSENISGQTYEMLREKVKAFGLSMSNFERFKPWFAAMTVAALEIQKMGYDPDLGIDRYFFNKASKDHKEMRYLETNEYQIKLMATMSRRQQEQFLEQTLKEIEIIETMTSDMIEAWRSGNADKLGAIIEGSFVDHPEIYDRLFVHRNRRWVSRIKRIMREGEDVLLIVGAGHLVGKNNLIELLEKTGFEIRQM